MNGATTTLQSKQKQKPNASSKVTKKEEEKTAATPNADIESVESAVINDSSPPNPLENPVWLMAKALENKMRNLRKRELRLEQLKAEKERAQNKFQWNLECLNTEENKGIDLTSDQKESLSKLDEVKLQIAFVEEMKKMNATQLRLYKKALKDQERELKKAQSQSVTTRPIPEEKESIAEEEKGRQQQVQSPGILGQNNDDEKPVENGNHGGEGENVDGNKTAKNGDGKTENGQTEVVPNGGHSAPAW